MIDLQNKKNFYLTPPYEKIGGIDGLYFYKNSLIAVQPFDEGRRIVRYYLNKTLDAIIKTEIIEADHKVINQPTTGAIAGRKFFYIANSQLQVFRGIFQPDGNFDRSKLSEVFVMKVGL